MAALVDELEPHQLGQAAPLEDRLRPALDLRGAAMPLGDAAVELADLLLGPGELALALAAAACRSSSESTKRARSCSSPTATEPSWAR
jgi:hypothetical protein